MSDDETRKALRGAVRAFLARSGATDIARRMAADPESDDAGAWRVLAGQLGIAGLGVREDLGGAGGTWRDLVVAFEELGAVLLPTPLFATRALAVTALTEAGDVSACAKLLPGLATGELRGTAVLDRGAFRARATAGGFELSGRAELVLDGACADVLVVPAETDGAPGLFAVTSDAAGITREKRAVVDPTRPAARLVLRGTPARRLQAVRPLGDVLRRTVDLARLALAAEQLGGAQRCLDLTVAHVKERAAFGRPIGSFQAVKHACADVLVEVESLRPAVEEAGRLAAVDREAFEALLPVVSAHAADAYCRAAATCVHLHGGMGFTWEHPAQLYYKRAMTSARLFGAPREHRERAVARLLSERAEGRSA